MKYIIERADERGKSDLGWLQSRFSFSFADYYNPLKMGFGKLRVLNDDIIAKGMGFGTHPHANMEIITIPTYGTVAHKDSTGVEETVSVGEVQVMSAGTGLTHSEYNFSKSDRLELFQIWIEPKKKNIKPKHDKMKFHLGRNSLVLVVTGFDDSDKKRALTISQDARILLGRYDKDQEIAYKTSDKRGFYMMLIEGKLKINDMILERRDSISISEAIEVKIKVLENSYFLIIEVPIYVQT